MIQQKRKRNEELLSNDIEIIDTTEPQFTTTATTTAATTAATTATTSNEDEEDSFSNSGKYYLVFSILIISQLNIVPLSEMEKLLLFWKRDGQSISENKFNQLCDIIHSPFFKVSEAPKNYVSLKNKEKQTKEYQLQLV